LLPTPSQDICDVHRPCTGQAVKLSDLPSFAATKEIPANRRLRGSLDSRLLTLA
jgi:hypothetical protein